MLSGKEKIAAKIRRYEKELESLRTKEAELLAQEENAGISRRQEEGFRKCQQEAIEISERLDYWLMSPESNMLWQKSKDFKGAVPSTDLLSLLFLGGCSGQWAARTRYRGHLPGFGGFLLFANGTSVLIDPGAFTFDEMLAQGFHPAFLNAVIATHAHWDCIRDLQLVVMAALPFSKFQRYGGLDQDSLHSKFHLYADKSALFGVPITGREEEILQRFDQTGLDSASREVFPRSLQGRLANFTTVTPPALSYEELLLRLYDRYTQIDIGQTYVIDNNIRFITRKSYHDICPGEPYVPGLDFIINNGTSPPLRCVYLSDTEYRPELASSYRQEDLGAIDVLICNVKTLDIFQYQDGPYQGYTRRHLGWKGLLDLCRDFDRLELLHEHSQIIIRAWGIETVTELYQEDNVLVATPDKLQVYEDLFHSKTKKNVVVPGITWVTVPKSEQGQTPAAMVRHIKAPFIRQGFCRRFGNLSYSSRQMDEVVRKALAVTDAPDLVVLITGESGTGKDELAKAIHNEAKLSKKRKGEFVALNAQQYTGGLFMDQLTGHTKGSFSSASEFIGGFARAKDGTLEIQEIHDLDMSVQTSLLTPLQSREFYRLGDLAHPLPISCQIIFTTDRDLQQEVTAKQFLKQLYFRINRIIDIAPLRERKEDIAAILDGWYNDKPSGLEKMPSPDADLTELLQQYDWPGNVRQLFNCMAEISSEDQQGVKAILDKSHDTFNHPEQRTLAKSLKELEPDLDELDEKIIRSLSHAPSSLKEIQQHILPQVSKSTIYYHLKKLIIHGLIAVRGQGPNSRYFRSSQ